MFIASIVLWLLFIIFTNLKNRVLPKVEGTVGEVPIMWIFTIFGIIDVVYNFIYGTILFLELPSFKRLTLTLRLRHILQTDFGWRNKLAGFICRRLIEPWDYNHCGLITNQGK